MSKKKRLHQALVAGVLVALSGSVYTATTYAEETAITTVETDKGSVTSTDKKVKVKGSDKKIKNKAKEDEDVNIITSVEEKDGQKSVKVDLANNILLEGTDTYDNQEHVEAYVKISAPTKDKGKAAKAVVEASDVGIEMAFKGDEKKGELHTDFKALYNPDGVKLFSSDGGNFQSTYKGSSIDFDTKYIDYKYGDPKKIFYNSTTSAQNMVMHYGVLHDEKKTVGLLANLDMGIHGDTTTIADTMRGETYITLSSYKMEKDGRHNLINDSFWGVNNTINGIQIKTRDESIVTTSDMKEMTNYVFLGHDKSGRIPGDLYIGKKLGKNENQVTIKVEEQPVLTLRKNYPNIDNNSDQKQVYSLVKVTEDGLYTHKATMGIDQDKRIYVDNIKEHGPLINFHTINANNRHVENVLAEPLAENGKYAVTTGQLFKSNQENFRLEAEFDKDGKEVKTKEASNLATLKEDPMVKDKEAATYNNHKVRIVGGEGLNTSINDDGDLQVNLDDQIYHNGTRTITMEAEDQDPEDWDVDDQTKGLHISNTITKEIDGEEQDSTAVTIDLDADGLTVTGGIIKAGGHPLGLGKDDSTPIPGKINIVGSDGEDVFITTGKVEPPAEDEHATPGADLSGKNNTRLHYEVMDPIDSNNNVTNYVASLEDGLSFTGNENVDKNGSPEDKRNQVKLKLNNNLNIFGSLTNENLQAASSENLGVRRLADNSGFEVVMAKTPTFEGVNLVDKKDKKPTKLTVNDGKLYLNETELGAGTSGGTASGSNQLKIKVGEKDVVAQNDTVTIGGDKNITVSAPNDGKDGKLEIGLNKDINLAVNGSFAIKGDDEQTNLVKINKTGIEARNIDLKYVKPQKGEVKILPTLNFEDEKHQDRVSISSEGLIINNTHNKIVTAIKEGTITLGNKDGIAPPGMPPSDPGVGGTLNIYSQDEGHKNVSITTMVKGAPNLEKVNLAKDKDKDQDQDQDKKVLGINRIQYKGDNEKDTHTVATLEDGLAFKGNDDQVVKVKLNNLLNVTGGIGKDDLGKASNANIGVKANGDNGLEIVMSKTPTFDGVNTKTITIKNNDGQKEINLTTDGKDLLLGTEALAKKSDIKNTQQLQIKAGDNVVKANNGAVAINGGKNINVTATNKGENGELVVSLKDKIALDNEGSIQINNEQGKTAVKLDRDGITLGDKDGIAPPGERPSDPGVGGTLNIYSKDDLNHKKVAITTLADGAASLGETGDAKDDGKKGKAINRVQYQGEGETAAHTLATMEDGLAFQGNDNNIVRVKLNETLKLQGGINVTKQDAPATSNENMAVKYDTQAKALSVEMATKPKFEGVTIKNADSSNNVELKATDKGLDVGGKKVTNLEDATLDENSTDAVTGKQLKAVSDKVDTVESTADAAKKATEELKPKVEKLEKGEFDKGSVTVGKVAKPQTEDAPAEKGVAGTINIVTTGDEHKNVAITTGAGDKYLDTEDKATRVIYNDGKDHQLATMDDGLSFTGDNKGVAKIKLNGNLNLNGGLDAKGTGSSKNIGVRLNDKKDGFNIVMSETPEFKELTLEDSNDKNKQNVVLKAKAGKLFVGDAEVPLDTLEIKAAKTEDEGESTSTDAHKKVVRIIGKDNITTKVNNNDVEVSLNKDIKLANNGSIAIKDKSGFTNKVALSGKGLVINNQYSNTSLEAGDGFITLGNKEGSAPPGERPSDPGVGGTLNIYSKDDLNHKKVAITTLADGAANLDDTNLEGTKDKDPKYMNRVQYQGEGDENAHTLATMEDGLGFQGNDKKIVRVKLNNNLNIIGGITDPEALKAASNTNIGVRYDENTKGLTIVMAKTPTFAGLTIEKNDDSGKKVNLTTDGSDLLLDGAALAKKSDIITPVQLKIKAGVNEVTPNDGAVSINGGSNITTVAKDNGVLEVSLNDQVNLTNAGSITIAGATGEKPTDSITLNNSGLQVGNSGPSVTTTGINAGNKKITNVLAGEIAANSKDAINGGQLFGVQTTANEAKGTAEAAKSTADSNTTRVENLENGKFDKGSITVGKVGENGKDGTPGTLTIISKDKDPKAITITTGDGVGNLDSNQDEKITRIIYNDGKDDHQVATMDDGLSFKGNDDQVVKVKLNNLLNVTGGLTDVKSTTVSNENIGVRAKDNGLEIVMSKTPTFDGVNIKTITLENDKKNTKVIKISDDGADLLFGEDALAKKSDIKDAKQLKIKAGKTEVTAANDVVTIKGGNNIAVTATNGGKDGQLEVSLNKEIVLDKDSSITLNDEQGKAAVKLNKDGITLGDKDGIAPPGERPSDPGVGGKLNIITKDDANHKNIAITTVANGAAKLDETVLDSERDKDKVSKVMSRVQYQGEGEKTAHTLATMEDGLAFQGNDNNIVRVKLNETLKLQGGIDLTATQPVATSNENMAVKYDAQGKALSIEMATKPKFDGVTIKNTAQKDGSKDVKLTATDKGLDVGGKKITNLADAELGKDSTDAVTGKQLHATNEKVEKLEKGEFDKGSVTVGVVDKPQDGDTEAKKGTAGTINIVTSGDEHKNVAITTGDGDKYLNSKADDKVTRVIYNDGTAHQLATMDDGLSFTGDNNGVAKIKLNGNLNLNGGLDAKVTGSSKNIGVRLNNDNNGFNIVMSETPAFKGITLDDTNEKNKDNPQNVSLSAKDGKLYVGDVEVPLDTLEIKVAPVEGEATSTDAHKKVVRIIGKDNITTKVNDNNVEVSLNKQIALDKDGSIQINNDKDNAVVKLDKDGITLGNKAITEAGKEDPGVGGKLNIITKDDTNHKNIAITTVADGAANLGETGAADKEEIKGKAINRVQYQGEGEKTAHTLATMEDGLAFQGNDNNIVRVKLNNVLNIKGGIDLTATQPVDTSNENIAVKYDEKANGLSVEMATKPKFDGVTIKNAAQKDGSKDVDLAFDNDKLKLSKEVNLIGLKDAEINDKSTDAVTGKQLHATNEKFEAGQFERGKITAGRLGKAATEKEPKVEAQAGVVNIITTGNVQQDFTITTGKVKPENKVSGKTLDEKDINRLQYSSVDDDGKTPTTHVVATMDDGLSFTGNDNNVETEVNGQKVKVNQNKINLPLNKNLSLTGGLKDEALRAAVSDNLGVIRNSDGTGFNIVMTTNPKFDTVILNNQGKDANKLKLSASEDGETLLVNGKAVLTGEKTVQLGIKVGDKDLEAKNNKITINGDNNIKATIDDTHKEQLNLKLNNQLSLEGTEKAPASITLTNDKQGKTVLFDGGLTVGNDQVKITNKGIGLDNDKVKINNEGLTINNGPSVTDQGINASNKVITNVSDGAIAKNSKDAVNGGQLWAATQKVEALGNTVNNLNTQMGTVQNDVGDLKTNVNNLQTDVGGLKNNVADLQSNVGKLQTGLQGVDKKVDNVAQDLTKNITNINNNLGKIKTTVDNLGLSTNKGEHYLNETDGKTQKEVEKLVTKRVQYGLNGEAPVSLATMKDGVNFQGDDKQKVGINLNNTLSIMGGMDATLFADENNIRTGNIGIRNNKNGLQVVMNKDITVESVDANTIKAGEVKLKDKDNQDITLTAKNNTLAINGRPLADGEAVNNVMNNMASTINELGAEVQTVGAQSAALASLKPLSYKEDEPTQLMVGFGNYRHSNAWAIGLAHYTKENVMLNAGVSLSSRHRMMNVGLSTRFGHRKDKNEVALNPAMPADVATLQSMVGQLQNENKDLQQKYENLAKQVDVMMELLKTEGKM